MADVSVIWFDLKDAFGVPEGMECPPPAARTVGLVEQPGVDKLLPVVNPELVMEKEGVDCIVRALYNVGFGLTSNSNYPDSRWVPYGAFRRVLSEIQDDTSIETIQRFLSVFDSIFAVMEKHCNREVDFGDMAGWMGSGDSAMQTMSEILKAALEV